MLYFIFPLLDWAFNEVVRVLRNYAGINLDLSFIWCFQIYLPHLRTGFCMGFPGGIDSKVSACNTGDPGSISGFGRSPGEGNGNPLQYSCLENSLDRGAWPATVHGFAESQTPLRSFHFSLSYQPRRTPWGRLSCMQGGVGVARLWAALSWAWIERLTGLQVPQEPRVTALRALGSQLGLILPRSLDSWCCPRLCTKSCFSLDPWLLAQCMANSGCSIIACIEWIPH